MGMLHARGMAQEQIGAVEIVLAEVVNNIVEHAYAGVAPGEVVITGDIQDKTLKLTAIDFGKPLPEGKLPEGKPADVSGDIQDLPEGGFGWFMIRTLTRDTRYRRDNDQNRLELTMDLVPAADTH
jgi:serine/threonine-protein kinase RsbW